MRGPRLRQVLTLALAFAGLIWGLSMLPRSEEADQFRTLNAQLLRSENFRLRDLTARLAASNSTSEHGCDSDKESALLIIEMRLVDTALHAGDTAQFDHYSQSVTQRAKQALSCAPRQSFIWLIAFSQAVLNGRLDSDAFKMLSLSYHTSSNEGWLSVRRNFIVTPLIAVLPLDLRADAQEEFAELIDDGFEAEAAKSFVRASQTIQPMLLASVQNLSPARQRAFQMAVQQLQSDRQGGEKAVSP